MPALDDRKNTQVQVVDRYVRRGDVMANKRFDEEGILIWSRTVDKFLTRKRTLKKSQPWSHRTVAVSPSEEAPPPVCGTDPAVVPIAHEISPNNNLQFWLYSKTSGKVIFITEQACPISIFLQPSRSLRHSLQRYENLLPCASPLESSR